MVTALHRVGTTCNSHMVYRSPSKRANLTKFADKLSSLAIKESNHTYMVQIAEIF